MKRINGGGSVGKRFVNEKHWPSYPGANQHLEKRLLEFVEEGIMLTRQEEIKTILGKAGTHLQRYGKIISINQCYKEMKPVYFTSKDRIRSIINFIGDFKLIKPEEAGTDTKMNDGAENPVTTKQQPSASDGEQTEEEDFDESGIDEKSETIKTEKMDEDENEDVRKENNGQQLSSNSKKRPEKSRTLKELQDSLSKNYQVLGKRKR
ncbi:unnamed protein product [Didymodactylos carnosus]|uniref:Uncharacterized protein n=1 Tax=Didymodactylos carnosus TaxID=1234261 RepID=A0A813TN12_9BILA|nr:unnamed protein product [Didymodactylos carnosus]CAF3599975.1 unnamed protein product [Didymodactylos carnosus]